MTLGTFLDAAYAALIDEYRKLGSDLQSALSAMEMWRAGGPAGERPQTIEQTTPQQDRARRERSQEVENELALAELQKMMAGVNFG